MSQSKQLLIPWLRTQIDSGRYPGVMWTNQEQTEFCIPWKHALRQDSSSLDVLVFKSWAEVSGNGRAHGDPSVWKRNFRSALRAKGFKMVADKKNDAANPHKVFRWPEEASSGGHQCAGSQDQEDADQCQVLPFPVQEASTGSQDFPGHDDFFYLPEGAVFTGGGAEPDILEQCLLGLNIEAPIEGVVLPVCELPLEYPQDMIGGAALPEQPADGAVGVACEQQMVEQFMDNMSRTMVGEQFKTQFRVLVFYRGVKVSEQLVSNEAGLRLVYRPDLTQPVLDPQSNLSLVPLPSPGAMLDKTQANLTQRILDKLGGGLEVGVAGSGIYSQRLGESHAFWSLCKFDRSKQPQEVAKRESQMLFQFKDFVRGILAFISGNESPPCSLFFCLGEKWPDPDQRPWEKKLVTVEVVLTSLEILKSIAVSGGASSLQSVELQMSLEEMMELC
ncbi:interferon regulatory factor 3 isoform X2 [Lampris incognitus]|uniref:interferon regulatory factor 3 isoform X2 n=1 Tax=Lampris incognitus TaxID=2546036 RepID=UPI0024B584B6|nr:interferon regulatory factor 3 isoform X2 [Lampris incognitus]